jgi:hypothetical protein
VSAVQVSEDVVCVFNATPLEKYESYRLHLARWAQEEPDSPDLTPTVHNLIESLANFAGINRYSQKGSQPKFLVDLLPEVYGGALEDRLLSRLGTSSDDVAHLLQRVEERGSAYLHHVNAFYVREFQMMYVAEEAARFLFHACQGWPTGDGKLGRSDEFYARVVENTVAYFGARVLYPNLPAEGEDLNAEVTAALYQQSLKSALRGDFDAVARELGYQLGNDLYSDYLAGRFNPSAFRRLLLTHLSEPGTAKTTCVRLLGRNRKKRPASTKRTGSQRRIG